MKGKKEGRKEGRKKGRKEKKKEMEDWYQDQNLGTRAPVIGQMSQTVDWRLNQGPGHSSAQRVFTGDDTAQDEVNCGVFWN
jgi:hypothetical protein